MPLNSQTLYVFLVSGDNEGEQAIPYYPGPEGMTPMITSSEKDLKFLRRVARDYSAHMGTPVRLVRWHQCEDLETIDARH